MEQRDDERRGSARFGAVVAYCFLSVIYKIKHIYIQNHGRVKRGGK